MPARELTIVNRLGLHARAASKLVALASKYQCDIRVQRGSRQVNGKSIMGLMMLAAARGSTVNVSAEGPDADAALDAIEQLIAARFEEAE